MSRFEGKKKHEKLLANALEEKALDSHSSVQDNIPSPLGEG
jgi:hypothetical protein